MDMSKVSAAAGKGVKFVPCVKKGVDIVKAVKRKKTFKDKIRNVIGAVAFVVFIAGCFARRFLKY